MTRRATKMPVGARVEDTYSKHYILQPISVEEVINCLKNSNNFRLIKLAVYITILYITNLNPCRKQTIYLTIWKQMWHLNYHLFSFSFYHSFCRILSYFRSFSSTFRVQKAGQIDAFNISGCCCPHIEFPCWHAMLTTSWKAR